jgi:hypothetical protein
MRSNGDGSLVEAMELSPSWRYLQLTGWLMWSSQDLLTTYNVEFPSWHVGKKPKKQQHAPRLGLSRSML